MTRYRHLFVAALCGLSITFALLAGCATPPSSATITLILPDAFTGDIFLVAGDERDPRCERELVVPLDGIVYVSNFSDIRAIPRHAFRSKTQSGQSVRSSLHVDAIGPKLLWPVGKLHDSLLYFVVGSLDDKIRLSTEKERNWPAIVARLRARSQR